MPCVFCELIREDRAHWVARGPQACAFTPRDPLAPGHTLVVPTSHFADLFDTPSEVLAETTALVQRLAKAMRTGLNVTGVNILSANGPASEQSVHHLHFHVVPRWPEDGISTWPTGRSHHRLAGDPAKRIAHALAETGQRS
ncbi:MULTISPECIES: HIT family protein [Streptomyces]|uniref:HIT domain-containing protein n=2 Tax=Streptomyces TaxID=1883 RepID=A0ABU4KIB9_9ACTN|nr:HIT domain-containing protein [Streptomyces roseolus]MDX2297477.1 HIT domain-containing protein [Streptomyces roseolus]